jgi:hypothetical protein
MSRKSLNEVMSLKLKFYFHPFYRAISYNFGSRPFCSSKRNINKIALALGVTYFVCKTVRCLNFSLGPGD